MEQTAVQLMSRKQRAAKLLTGDIGLTGLDALTEGEGGFEQALLDAIGRDETLFDPAELFKAADAVSEIDTEDASYWNVEDTPVSTEEMTIDEPDPLITLALELGATITPVENSPQTAERSASADLPAVVPAAPRPVEAVMAYLETVHLIADEATWLKRRAELLTLLDGGTAAQIATWLTEHHIVFPGFEREVATKVIELVSGHTENTAVEPIIKPSRPITLSKRAREREHQSLRSPQREAVREEAFAQQLALF